jgi:hypothetical protein
MIESTFDSCLLHINQINQIEFIEFINQSNFISHFEIVDLQNDDTLIFANDEFVALKESELIRAHLIFKKREKLNLIISIKFNDELIILIDNDNKFVVFDQFNELSWRNQKNDHIQESIRRSTNTRFLYRNDLAKRSLIFRSLLKLSISKRKTRSDWINVYNDK